MNMTTDTQLEAQRLVSISLSKMAQSRTQRTGVSLHKSLLVATVLQKARFLCMEEVFKMVHPSTPQAFQQQQCYSYDDNDDEDDDDEDDDTLIGLTPEEAGVIQGNDFGNNCLSESSYETDSLSFDEYTSNENTDNYCSQTLVEYDKENLAPSCSVSVIDNATYFDLDDKTSRDQTDKYSYSSSNNGNSNSGRALKRRRTICESETEDCAQLTSRKKTRVSIDDSVFLDEEDEEIEQLYNVVHGCSEETETENKAMDIDRITSLVSIFSFGTMSNNSNLSDIAASNSSSSTNNCITNSNFGNLTRSSSTPDLCSAQAKEADSIQQRPYLAMTV